MPLASLQLQALRCVEDAALEFSPGINLIHGENGSGKTSLLESVFLLGRGRSFRTRFTEKLIRRGAQRLQVFGRTAEPAHRIGFSYDRQGEYQARLDGRDVASLAELPSALFVEAIDPDIHRLVEGGPGERRRWLDWGVFHVEHQFLATWLRFSRALRQRNAALKSGQDPRPWEPELIEQAGRVAAFREHWLATLEPVWASAVQRLVGQEVSLGYSRGWGQDRTLEEALRDAESRDRERGSTSVGPQRADILLRMGQASARDVLSRGQQKLVAVALVLAVMQRLRELRTFRPTLLLDDPAAELDPLRLGRLVELVGELDCQLIVTSLRPDLHLFGQPDRVFHVEHGRVAAA